MNIKPEQLTQQLKKTLSSVYILSGDEPLQIIECSDQIRKTLKDNGFNERKLFHIDSKFNWDEFTFAYHSLSLFSNKQLIELRIDQTINDQGKKALAEYISKQPKHCILLIIFNQLNKSTQKTKWFQSLETNGCFIQVWPINDSQFANWLSKRIRQTGYSIEPKALELLVEKTQGNLLAATQEVKKLKLLSTNHLITSSTVELSITENARFDVFQLMDYILKGDVKRVVRIVNLLKIKGTELPILLWALTRDIRLLLFTSRSKALKKNPQEVITQLSKIYGFPVFLLKKRQPIINQCLSRFSEKDLRFFLQNAAKIDQIIKGVISANPWRELLSLCVQMTSNTKMNFLHH